MIVKEVIECLKNNAKNNEDWWENSLCIPDWNYPRWKTDTCVVKIFRDNKNKRVYLAPFENPQENTISVKKIVEYLEKNEDISLWPVYVSSYSKDQYTTLKDIGFEYYNAYCVIDEDIEENDIEFWIS